MLAGWGASISKKTTKIKIDEALTSTRSSSTEGEPVSTALEETLIGNARAALGVVED